MYNSPEISSPVRMCIVCKTRLNQSELIRLQCFEGNLRGFTGSGRSFYMCHNCLEKDTPKKILLKYCKNSDLTKLMFQLKEIAQNVR